MIRRHILPTVALTVGMLVGGGVATAAHRQPPPEHVVTNVTGSFRDGFDVEFLDGSAIFTPTWSETLAECSEYRTRLNRVRCRVSERTSFRHYALLRDSLWYARMRSRAMLRPCPEEDSGRWCIWDARVRGNGVGHSFWRDGQGVAWDLP